MTNTVFILNLICSFGHSINPIQKQNPIKDRKKARTAYDIKSERLFPNDKEPGRDFKRDTGQHKIHREILQLERIGKAGVSRFLHRDSWCKDPV